MALRYDLHVSRFRDDRGHFISYSRGMRSSVARAQYHAATAERTPGQYSFHPASGRFFDQDGRRTTQANALKSSTARAQYNTFLKAYRPDLYRPPPKPLPRRVPEPEIPVEADFVDLPPDNVADIIEDWDPDDITAVLDDLPATFAREVETWLPDDVAAAVEPAPVYGVDFGWSTGDYDEVIPEGYDPEDWIPETDQDFRDLFDDFFDEYEDVADDDDYIDDQ